MTTKQKPPATKSGSVRKRGPVSPLRPALPDLVVAWASGWNADIIRHGYQVGWQPTSGLVVGFKAQSHYTGTLRLGTMVKRRQEGECFPCTMSAVHLACYTTHGWVEHSRTFYIGVMEAKDVHDTTRHLSHGRVDRKWFGTSYILVARLDVPMGDVFRGPSYPPRHLIAKDYSRTRIFKQLGLIDGGAQGT